MRLPIAVCFVLATFLATARAASDADSTRTGQSSFRMAPLSQGLLLSKYSTHDTRDNPTPNALTFSLSPFTTQPYVPQSFFDAALYGAGTAGTLAMFIGAIGNTLGAFDEDTTWIMTGAAAAAGALYSVSHFNVRMSLGPDEWTPRPPSDR
jgi:hypothetical protein